MTRVIVFDIEIVRGPLNRNEQPVEGIQYARSWETHAEMGVSCIGVYDYRDDIYLTFLDTPHDRRDFAELVEASDLIVSYNGLSFDNRVLDACYGGIGAKLDAKTYDLLVEIWKASELGPKFVYPSHAGFGLDAVSAANGGPPKTGHGALAPVLWQQGRLGEVLRYCTNDVRLTRRLIDLLRTQGHLKCPKTGKQLAVRKPF